MTLGPPPHATKTKVIGFDPNLGFFFSEEEYTQPKKIILTGVIDNFLEPIFVTLDVGQVHGLCTWFKWQIYYKVTTKSE